MAAKGYNPFDDVSYDLGDEGIDDDEFISDEAAVAELIEADNRDVYIFGDTTVVGRNPDETFQNMTIGQYIRQGSTDISFLQQVGEGVLTDSSVPELVPISDQDEIDPGSFSVDDDDWDFTLSDVNQLVEGINDLGFDAAFAQVMAKQKIKQQGAAKEKMVELEPSTQQQGTGNNSLNNQEQPVPIQPEKTPLGSERHQYTTSEPKSPPSPLLKTVTATSVIQAQGSDSFPDTGDHPNLNTSDTDSEFALDSSMRHRLMESIRPGHDGPCCGGEVGNNSMISADDSAMDVTLLCDNNNMTLPNNLTAIDFAASTPMYNHQPNVRDLGLLRQSAIHHIVTPQRIQEILDLPTRVDVPEVCCVFLSQQVQFTVRNKLRSGVQCSFSINKMAFNGNVVDGCVCPFDFNRRITLCPNSQETMQVLFTPTSAGHFYATMEVTAQNLINSQENRTYEVVLSGRAESPKFKILPNSEEIDFGDVIWGSSDHKTIKVQNVGQATVPIRFTVIRTNSPLCNFSFHSSDTNADLSRTPLTMLPHNSIHSVISMPLPGVREGGQAVTHSVNVYCHVKGVDTASRKYSEACEIFEGVLSMELDSPITKQTHLTQFRLRVRAGMVKLHLDRAALVLSSLPGQTKEGTVKVVNSGNISMKVALDLEPSSDQFRVMPRQMVVDPNAYQLARVSFTPGDYKDVDVRLVLSDQVCINFMPVRGQTRQHFVTKITASTSSISFGGVQTGDKSTKMFKFSLDRDVQVKCFIRQAINSPFQVASDEGMVKDSIEMAMTKGVRSTINIVFIPEEVKWFSSTLVLQVLHGDSFSIPLSGYGGVSNIKFKGVTETSSGETVIPISRAEGNGSSPFTHCMTVTNLGVRSAFVKAVFYDMGHNVISPHLATVMPSELFLAPQESQEMMLWMLDQPVKDKTYGGKGMVLKGIIKLTYGDEINRQLLRKNPSSDCQRLALNYILELTQDQKSVVHAEMQHLPGEQTISLNAFKSSIRSKKIGLLAKLDVATPDQTRPSVSANVRSISSPSFGPRPVLQTVNLNVQQQQQQQQPLVPTKGDEEWTLSPVSISFKVQDARSKEFAQIINYTDKGLRFSLESDDCLNVTPAKGMIGSKGWCQLEVMTSGKFWSALRKPLCALIKVRCNEETKHIRVLIENEASTSKMPVFTAQDTVTAESSRHNMLQAPSTTGNQSLPGGDGLRLTNTVNTALQSAKGHRLASSCHHQHPVPDKDNRGILGPEMVIIPPVCLGSRTEFSYVFTNISQETITWKALPVGPISCEPVPQNPSSSVDSSVFNPHPSSGTLEAGGVQMIALSCIPLVAGSYRQVWGIEYFGMTCTNLHTFTIYAKTTSRDTQSDGTQEVPTSLSPKRQQQKHQNHNQPALQQQPQNTQRSEAADNLPKWTSCQPQPTSARLSATSSDSQTSTHVMATASFDSATTTTTTTSTVAQNIKQPDLSTNNNNNTERGGPSDNSGCLQLMEKLLQFPKLNKGKSETLFLRLKNTGTQDAEITVEQQPGAPFIIRHTNFTVRKNRLTKLPVLFKPLHMSMFREQVVMREKHSNITFVAVLEAECVP